MLKMIVEKKRCFTILEVSIAALVFTVSLVTLLALYINSSQLAEFTTNATKSLFSAQKMVETIRNHNFSGIETDYANYTFDPEGFPVGTAKGIVYVTQYGGRSDILQVNIVICFRVGQRIIGEDLDLDGALDSGEDSNGNAVLDSVTEITTLLTSR